MKIIITGAKGQLGTDCAGVLGQKHKVVAIDLDEIDITIFPEVEKTIKAFLPDIVVNCAAYTQVDNCEIEKKLAWKVNVTGVKNLATCLQRFGGQLIHISTDYVFDGKKKLYESYMEEDDTNPISYYGITKLEGEKAVQETVDNHIILRTAWMYGICGHNFLKTMAKLSLENPEKELKVVNDQFGSPTWSYTLAKQIELLIEKGGHGIYHATSEGYCSWYDFARFFLDGIGISHTVVPCSSKEYQRPAPRPQNSILENHRLKQEKVNIMPNWLKDVEKFIDNYGKVLISEVKKTC